MKKSTKIQTIISVVLIIAVLLFGVASYFISQQQISSKIKFVVKDTTVNVEIQGKPLWASEGDYFDTKTNGINGFDNQNPILPNLVLANEPLDKRSATLELVVTNKNNTEGYNLKFEITGLAYDANNRFSTTASYKIGTAFEGEEEITSDGSYSFSVSTTNTQIVIHFVYELNDISKDFTVNQNITVTISQVLADA